RGRSTRTKNRRDHVCDLARWEQLSFGALVAGLNEQSTNPGDGCPTAVIARSSARLVGVSDENRVGSNATPPTDPANAPQSANSRSRQHDTTWTASTWGALAPEDLARSDRPSLTPSPLHSHCFAPSPGEVGDTRPRVSSRARPSLSIET